MGLGRVLDGNAVGVGSVSVKCGCGVGPWRAAAAQRLTNGRRQALVPAADHQSSLLPEKGHGTVGEVKQRSVSGLADAGMMIGSGGVVRRRCARSTGRLKVRCIALQLVTAARCSRKPGCRSETTRGWWPAQSGRQVRRDGWVNLRG